MYPVELLLLFINGLNPTVTAAFISTFNSFIAVGGSLLGAITGSALTLYFTGHNQRKHLEREAELKRIREFEERKKMLLLEIIERWKNFIQAGMEHHTFLQIQRVKNKNPDTSSSLLLGEESIRKFNHILAEGEAARLNEAKFLYYWGETEEYFKIKQLHLDIMNYNLTAENINKDKVKDMLGNLHQQRDELVLIFRRLS